MRRGSLKAVVFVWIISMLLTACTGPEVNAVLPSTSSPTLTSTLTIPNSPFPSETSTPTLFPTQTPTLIPLPSQQELEASFANEVEPLVQKLLQAQEKTDLELTSAYQLVYVPQTARLYYVQSLLRFGSPKNTSEGKVAYILYDYSRGETLGYSNNRLFSVSSKTQEVTATIRVILEDEGHYYQIEKEEATGSSGSTTPRNVVENAVSPLQKLISLYPESENELEEIIGYACGINMNPDLGYARNLALFSFALTSSNWADRRQGVEAIADLDPLPLSSATDLVTLLSDNGAGISSVAEDLLSEMIDDPEVFDLVSEAAASPDHGVRAHAAHILGNKPDQAFSILLTLSCDPNSYVQQEAKEAIKKSTPSDLIPSLVIALQDNDSCIRQGAASTLDDLDDQAVSAIPGLRLLLSDNTFAVRKAAALALCDIDQKNTEIIPVLTEVFKQETDSPLFTREITCIANIGGKEETLPLLEESVSADSETRFEVFDNLKNYQGVPGAADYLISLLESDESFLRWRAAEALQQYGDEADAALPILQRIAGTETDDLAFEEEIQLMIDLSSKEETLPILKQALSNPKYEVRRVACDILGTFDGVPGAVEVLLPALYDSDTYVPSYATNSLLEIAGDEKETVLQALTDAARATTNNHAFKSEIAAIAELSSKEATLPLLKEALSSSTIIIRSEACKILGTYKGVEGAQEIVSLALSDSQTSIREAARAALAALNESE
jgi:HEAT repeat protein